MNYVGIYVVMTEKTDTNTQRKVIDKIRSPPTKTIDRKNVESRDFTDVSNWSDVHIRKIKDEVNRADSEAQKVDNIVYAFLNVKSMEHQYVDKGKEEYMVDRNQLNFLVKRTSLEDWMSLLTVDQTIDFISTAVTEYTDFDSFEVDGESSITVQFVARK